MKNIKVIIIFLFSFSVLFAFAVKEQWRRTFTGIKGIVQVVADEKGGCAIATLDTNSLIKVVWCDKKGNVIYCSDKFLVSYIATIQSVSKNQLVYLATSPFPLFVQVDKKGRVTPVISIGGYMYPVPLTATAGNLNKFVDKKGFFVVNANTNIKSHAVIRYSYK